MGSLGCFQRLLDLPIKVVGIGVLKSFDDNPLQPCNIGLNLIELQGRCIRSGKHIHRKSQIAGKPNNARCELKFVFKCHRVSLSAHRALIGLFGIILKNIFIHQRRSPSQKQ